MSVDIFQLNFLKKIKKKSANSKNNYDSLSSFNYLSNSEELSEYYLKFLTNHNNFLVFIYIYIKNILSLLIFPNFEIVKSNKIENVDRAIISWGKKDDFTKSGIYFDKFFNTNSKVNKRLLWIVIYKGDELPKIIPKNFIIYKKKKIEFKFFSNSNTFS